MNDVLSRLQGGLVVSCQAYPGEPMRDSRTMTQIAQACVVGGAAGIRAQGIADLELITAAVDVPVIGLWKDGDGGVFITPTLDHALAVAATGCAIVAVDGTRRPRPDGRTLAEVIAGVKDRYPEVLIMADAGSADDARAAQDAGADILGTTLSGYTGERPRSVGPDLDLVAEIAGFAARPLIVEGRVHTPQQAAEAMKAGAFAVCVGTAITHPSTITGWFAGAVARHAPPESPPV
ncbi:MAG: N-acetylmannosamine-6-phosphate 2-epimerase [Propionibacteriales bacterium]|nr:N-acetylmannosamine-6-phosphate 2-epimerase [Propionibacteriales bacterium]